jgi:capsular exopolysaccharide synthesis family protein
LKTSDYLRILARSWLIIIITVIAGGMGGYWVYHSKTPVYQSSVQMIVSGSGSRPADEIASGQLATERALALSQVAGTAPAIDAAKRAAGYPDAAISVNATAGNNGPFLAVSVAGQSPAEVQAIADEFARTLPATIVRLEGPTNSGIRISDLAPASLPSKPVSPNIRRDTGFGLLVGLLVGIVIAIAREALDRTVRDSDDVAEMTDLTILGTVPRDLSKTPLPAMSSPRSARAEAYRQVRTTLINARRPQLLQTMAVTSASLGEGKTSVVTNVAAALGRAGRRVAVVDADLRRPSVAKFFGLGPGYGLTDVLAGTCSLRKALNVLDDGRLAVLTSGALPDNPSEALAGATMKHVLQQLADEYDYVLVDTPPVLPVTDPLVLAPLVDGVILVIRLGRTTRDRVQRARKALDRVNATVLGVVPNMSGKGSDRDYRYPYRYAYVGGRTDGSATLPVPVGNGQPPSQVRGR